MNELKSDRPVCMYLPAVPASEPETSPPPEEPSPAAPEAEAAAPEAEVAPPSETTETPPGCFQSFFSPHVHA